MQRNFVERVIELPLMGSHTRTVHDVGVTVFQNALLRSNWDPTTQGHGWNPGGPPAVPPQWTCRTEAHLVSCTQSQSKP